MLSDVGVPGVSIGSSVTFAEADEEKRIEINKNIMNIRE